MVKISLGDKEILSKEKEFFQESIAILFNEGGVIRELPNSLTRKKWINFLILYAKFNFKRQEEKNGQVAGLDYIINQYGDESFDKFFINRIEIRVKAGGTDGR